MTEKCSQLYQYLATFTALLSIVASGMHYAWPSPSISQYTSGSTTSFKITEDEGSWIIIMQTLAPLPVCFIAAALNDLIGRKKTLLISAIPYLIGWFMIAFAKSMVELLVARLLVGVSDGFSFTVISLYIAEIADPNIRGFLGTSISATWIFGMLLINVMGSYLSITMTAVISSIVPVLFIVTYIWMPESPYFLLMKEDTEHARNALKKFRGKNDVEDELKRLSEAVCNNSNKLRNALELFSKKGNLVGMSIVVITRNSQQLGGIAAITFYTLTIFSEAGNFISPLLATIIYVTVQCITTCVCSFLIAKTGNKPLLVASLAGSALCLFVEGSYFYVKDFTDVDTTSFNFLPVLALISFVIIFNLGAQPIPMYIQGELFPTNVKGLACCVSQVYFCILASVTSKLFQVLRDSYGMFVPFCGFAFCCVFNVIFVILFVPETKGKTLEEIQEILGGEKEVGGSNENSRKNVYLE